MNSHFTAALAALVLCLAPLGTARAQPDEAFHAYRADLRPRLNLDASAWREVVQDRVIVTLYAEQESPEPADGQAQVSQRLAPALERLKNTPDVEVQTAGYRTDPIWQQSRVVGWRTRGALQLTGKPSGSFNQLVGELASSLNVQSVTYHLSREARLAVEQELIGQSVQAFHAKADAAARALGFAGYEVGEITVAGSPAMGPEPAPRAMMMSRAVGGDEATPLPGAEGRTTVTMTVSGSVILKK